MIDASAPTSVPLPTTVKAAIGAVFAMIFFSIAWTLTAWSSTATWSKLLVDGNSKAKKPKIPYTAQQIASDLHKFRVSSLIQAIVVAIAMIVLVSLLRKAKQATLGRWALIVVMVITGSPFAAIPAKGWPPVSGALRMLEGVSSLAAIVLLLVPTSAAYFRECKAVAHPGAAPRPGMFSSMFGPRSTAARGGAAPVSTTPVSTTKAKTAPTTANPSVNKSKAKVRADDASAAKGADLARNRAKAAKSRKSED